MFKRISAGVSGALLALCLLLPAQAQEDAVLRIGTEGAYAPWNFKGADGELQGFEIDLGLALCERMNRECVFIEQDWNGIIPQLFAGRYDAIMASMSITEEREKTVDFSRPYATTPGAFVAGKDSRFAEITTLEELIPALKRKRIGVQRGTIYETFLRQETEARVIPYKTQDLANLDLAAGRVDATIADKIVLKAFLASDRGERFAFFGPDLSTQFKVLGDGVGVALRPEDDALEADFNAAICALARDGTIAEISAKWFDGDDYTWPCEDEAG